MLDRLMSGLLTLLVAVPVTFMIHIIYNALPFQFERAVLLVGVLFAALLCLVAGGYLLFRHRVLEPARLGLIMLTTVGLLLVSVYIFWVSSQVLFPADVLIWSEGDFVNDILKFRVGYPLYTAQENNESFTYTPGTQILTYLLASLLGNSISIPVYRMIQVGYTLMTAVVALFCCWRLIEISLPSRQIGNGGLWSAFWMPILFLISTNSLTNPFTHNLHSDALCQLVSVVAYWLLLEYVSTHDKRVLALMAVIPAVGFLVKQSLLVWAVFYCIQLVIFDRPSSTKRLATFIIATFGFIGVLVAGGYLLWGDSFFYWVFVVLGKHGVSPLRAFDHLLEVWAYVVIGLIGGFVLLRGRSYRPLLGPWLIWLSYLMLTVYTSGVDGMLNHIGPGSLIAGIWFLAALVRLWPLGFQVRIGTFRAQTWFRVGITVLIMSLLLSGLGIIRIPIRSLSEDAYRYIGEIEKEFEGQSAEDVLLDMGTWVYIKDGVIMKDRVPSIGERGYSETGDFSDIINRLEQKHYSKIIVRNLHHPHFHYDDSRWRQSSGIKRVLLENYHEIGRITAVSGHKYQHQTYFFAEISILVPIPTLTTESSK